MKKIIILSLFFIFLSKIVFAFQFYPGMKLRGNVPIYLDPVVATEAAQASVPTATIAFPGAEGFGAFQRHAFASTTPNVYRVTNNNSTGVGSLRAALTASGPRMVIFDTGGTIDLAGSDITIDNDYLYVAGQTVPTDSGGIQIKNGAIRPSARYLAIRGIKVRNGLPRDVEASPSDNRDGISIEDQARSPQYIIIDHCSLEWASDEIAVNWYENSYTTWQWNIIAEGLGSHGFGLLAGDRTSESTIHHNLFAFLKQRGPECNDDTAGEIVNNYIYDVNFEGAISMVGQPNLGEGGGFYNEYKASYWNVIGNQYRKGPKGATTLMWLQVHNLGWGDYSTHPDSRFYMTGNVYENTGDTDWDTAKTSSPSVSATDYRSLTPLITDAFQNGTEQYAITVNTASEAKTYVINNAGARVNGILDSIDAEIVAAVTGNTDTSRIQSGQAYVGSISAGDYPTLATGTAWADTDGGGIPDYWENANGLDKDDANDDLQQNPNTGYRYIEDWANSLITMPY